MRVNQPSNQIKLTNVSIVRLKKAGKRFEIACYKNKVQEWRNGVEKDLDEVLQISNVFLNVSKGEVANSDDLKKAFGKMKVDQIVKEILSSGELQVGEKERAHDQAALWKELATLVAEKCMDPDTQRPYSVGIIEKAMTEAGFSLKQDKTAKSQVSACIKHIQEHSKLPIRRSPMRLRVILSAPWKDELKKTLLEQIEKLEDETQTEEEWKAVFLLEPSSYKAVSDLINAEPSGSARLETLALSVRPGLDSTSDLPIGARE